MRIREERQVTRDEELLWQQISKTVTPFTCRAESMEHIVFKHKIINQKNLVNSSAKPELSERSVKTPHFLANEKIVINNLIRGKMRIEARLDLHGMTQDIAFMALNRFVNNAVCHGRHCLLIISGRGVDNQGILRLMVPRWLESMLPVRYCVQAQPHHGGAGAFYVLLKR